MIAILVLAVIGFVAALLLWLAAKKFHVNEDPRIGEVEAILPGANCGGCGFSGCRAFAEACCKATTLEGLNCPGAGAKGMSAIAKIVGLAPGATVPKAAVVRCDGTCSFRPHNNEYDGTRSCTIEAALYGGETDCVWGCLGCGDCVAVCPYDAIHITDEIGIPVVDYDKCVGCGKCVKACPKDIIELAPMHEDRTTVYVACKNQDKGGTAMKECQVACIGCMKCQKVCPSEAVTVANFLSHINYDNCISCGKCIEVCPRNSILTTPGKLVILPKEETQTIPN